MNASRGFRWFVRGVPAAALALLAGLAGAHPLGNFTISHYAAIDVGAAAIDIDYGLDLAEIPTFQEMERLDANHDGRVTDGERDAYLGAVSPAWAGGLSLTVDGRPERLALTSSRLVLLPGAGGLSTMRVWLSLSSPLPQGGGR